MDRASEDSPRKENTSSGTAQPRKTKKVWCIISDGSSEAEGEGKNQPSNTDKTQSTTSSGIDSLHSPPPEIEDSQEVVHKSRATISVVVPPPPTNSQRELFIPISSSLDTQSSSQLEEALELPSSSQDIVSDYPTPDSVQTQSPLISEQQSPLFFPEPASSPLSGTPLRTQTQGQSLISQFATSRQASEVLATQIVSSSQSNDVQITASEEVPQNQSPTASLPSAQPHAGSTSLIHETQANLGGITTLDHGWTFHTPPSRGPDKWQSQRSLHPSAGPYLNSPHQPQSSVAPSQFKTQVSPSQSQKGRLFGRVPTESTASGSSRLRDAASPRLRCRLRSPPRHSEEQGRTRFVRPKPQDTSSILIPRPTAKPFKAMAAPSHRSSPRNGRAVRATPSPRIANEMAITEPSTRSRGSYRRNVPSASLVEPPANGPAIPQIREPPQIQLATKTSNPALKVEMPGSESSSMQIDAPSTLEVSSGSEQPSGKDVPQTSSLQIQQSIEMDEPDKVDHSTQDSIVPTSSEAQDNGHTNSSSQGLMPNYPILLPREYAIPLHAEGKTQSAYRDIVETKQKAISKYLRRGSSSSTLSSSGLVTPKTEANEMAELVGKLDAIVSLVDLGYEGMLTQTSYSGSQLAEWAVKASSKFAFVKALIDYVRQSLTWVGDVVIFARTGQTQTLLEHFVSTFYERPIQYPESGAAVRVNAHWHPHLNSRGPSSSGMRLHLVAGGQKPRIDLRTGKSLIIAFDNSFDPRSEYVLDLRGADGRAERDLPTPVVHLLVSNSAEHIERCLPVNMPSPQRNRLLVQSILQGYRHLGKFLSEVNEVTLDYYSHLSKGTRIIDDDLMKTEQVFQKMPDFHLQRLARQVGKELLDDGFAADWSTFPAMQPLELDEMPGLVTQQLRLPSPSPMPASPIGTPSLRKRLLDGDGVDTPGGKRQRMTPIPGTSPHDQTETAQISHLQYALKVAKDETAKEKLLRMGAEEARDTARNQRDEWRHSVSNLQKRVEYHRGKDHKARTQVKQLQEENEHLHQLRARDATDRDALRAQITQLKSNLTLAQQDLLSAGGNTAALEAARTEALNAQTALTKAEADLRTAKEQGEYFRSAYQETMATGRQHQAEAETLQGRIAGLEIDARDEKRRLKLVNFDEAANAHLARIERMEVENRALQNMAGRLNRENIMLKAGFAANRGVSTRASSVQPPGSPRASIREARSRGGSPVPGVLGVVPGGLGGGRASALRHERS